MRRNKWRTGGGRKEVGLAQAVEREEQVSSHPSERERRGETGRCREMEIVGGRKRRVRRMDLFFSRI